jgi:hypothetical protein
MFVDGLFAVVLAADPGAVAEPSRGTGWLEVRVDAAAVVGDAAGDGPFVGPAAGLWAGARFHRAIGIHGGLSTFALTRQEVWSDDVTGAPSVSAAARHVYTQTTTFDIFDLRFFIPTRGFVEPHFDVGPFIALTRDRSSPSREYAIAAGGRFSAALDVWLGPHLSLGVALDERLLRYDRTISHILLAGINATAHW